MSKIKRFTPSIESLRAPKHECRYSKSMNQEYPRKCIDCGKPEGEAPKPEDFTTEQEQAHLLIYGEGPKPRTKDLITMALEAKANNRINMEVDTFKKHLSKHPLYAPISQLQVNLSKGGLPYYSGTLYDFFNKIAPELIKESLFQSYVEEEAAKLLEKLDSL